jgi:hypothetical protein
LKRAGIRTLLGETNATLVVAEQAASFWRGILRAPSTIVEDSLAAAPRAVDIVTVDASGTLTLADATRPVQLFNFANSHADDLLFTRAGGVGFVVDVYSPGNGAGALSAEFRDAIEDAGLDDGVFVGGHGGAVQTFAELDAAIGG